MSVERKEAGEGEVIPAERVGFLEAWKRGWTRWTWEGRTSRREYRLRTVSWLLEQGMLLGLTWVVGACAGMCARMWAGKEGVEVLEAVWPWWSGVWIAYALVQALAWIGWTVRRLHDAGFSGWWWFAGCIPFGALVLRVVLLVLPGERGLNAYGADPTMPRRRVRTPMDL